MLTIKVLLPGPPCWLLVRSRSGWEDTTLGASEAWRLSL